MMGKHFWRVTLFLIIFIALGGLQLRAQKDRVWGGWYVTNIQYEFTPKWFAYFELQSRSHAMFNHAFYYEVKGGLNYRINKNFIAFVGFGNYGTYDWQNLRGPKTVDELRLWEQFVINQPLNRLKFEHRFRFEQAWLNRKYRNRFRYRINLIVPLNKKQVEVNTVFASAFNEIFLTDTPPYFMRNRTYLGLGYQVTPFLSIQCGWVNQFNYNLQTKGGKNNLLFSFNFRVIHKDDKFEQIPSLPD